jgi:phosphatidylethanolamine-binding protein (PEBP) family uncharacterized protein
MRRPLEAISSAASFSSAALLLALALAGCGSSASGNASGTSSSGLSTVTTKPIPLTSTAFSLGSAIPARYTCDGANIAPPLKWGAVPPGTHEVVLFALGVSASGKKSTVEWAMGGLNPELHKVGAGEVPSGAFLEQASDGKRHYSICPPAGQTQIYKFIVYAVPSLIKVTSKINGTGLLHNLAEGPPNFRAPAEGELPTSYTRS